MPPVYRPAPRVPGLPFPRTRLSLFAAFPRVAAGLGTLVALVGFASGGLAPHWHALRAGGPAMFVLLASTVVLPIAIALVATPIVRGERRSVSMLLALAVSPAVLGGLVAFHYFSSADSFSESVDPAMQRQLQMAATAEISNLLTLGALAAGAGCVVVLLAAGGAVASIDVACGGAKRRSVVVTSVLAIAWVVATLVLFATFAPRRAMTGLSIVSVAVVVITAGVAVLIARKTSALRGWHDDVEARAHRGLVVLAAAAGIAATCLFERADVARETTLVLGESAERWAPTFEAALVHASDVARILALLAAARSHATCAVGLHVLLGGATFVSALLPALRRHSESRTDEAKSGPIASGWVGGLVAVLLVSVMLVGVSRRQKTFLAVDRRGPDLAGAPLPLIDSVPWDTAGAAQQTLRTPASGPTRMFGASRHRAATTDDVGLLAIAADRDATFGRVVQELEAPERSRAYRRYGLLTRHKSDGDGEWEKLGLGDLAALVGGDTIGLPFVLQSTTPPGSILTVRLSEGRLHAIPPGETAPVASASSKWRDGWSACAVLDRCREYEGVRLVVGADDRVADVAAALFVIHACHICGRIDRRAAVVIELARR